MNNDDDVVKKNTSSGHDDETMMMGDKTTTTDEGGDEEAATGASSSSGDEEDQKPAAVENEIQVSNGDDDDEKPLKRAKKETELRPLTGTAVVLKKGLGEKGLADRVVSDMHDYMRLDALGNIQKATTADAVCTELLKCHNNNDETNTDDNEAAIAEAALTKLEGLVLQGDFNTWPPADETVSLPQATFEARHALVNCMLTFSNNAEIQHEGCRLLHFLEGRGPGFLPSVVPVLQDFLVSEHFFSAMIGAVECDPNNGKVIGAALSVLSDLEQCLQRMRVSNADDANEESPRSIHLHRLHDSNAVPLLTVFKDSFGHSLAGQQRVGPHPFVQSTTNFVEVVEAATEACQRAHPEDIYLDRELFFVRMGLPFAGANDDE